VLCDGVHATVPVFCHGLHGSVLLVQFALSLELMAAACLDATVPGTDGYLLLLLDGRLICCLLLYCLIVARRLLLNATTTTGL
jgi:hypothetical protein